MSGDHNMYSLEQDDLYITLNSDNDPVNHPLHYTDHPSGIECIQITEHMGFCLGNAIKYIWRADLKNDAIEDLEKAKWYIERELQKRRKPRTSNETPLQEIWRKWDET